MSRAARTGLVLAAGGGCILAAMAIGRSDVLAALLEPPWFARLLLGAAAVSMGIWLVFACAERMRSSRDPATLIRAVRLVFLAVAAFAAAAGWFLGSAVPIVTALLIAGVDVVETTFLLLVAARAPTPKDQTPQDQTPQDQPRQDRPGQGQR